MNRAEKRIAIIKDVLKRLPKRRVHKNWYIRNIKVSDLKPEDLNIEAQCEINRIEKCQACALGNMLMSHIRVFDKLTLKDLGLKERTAWSLSGEFKGTGELESQVYRENTINPLKKYFSETQLNMIETAFEKKCMNYKFRLSPKNRNLAERCITFGRKYKADKARLRAIMQNMLKNNGIFVP